MYDMRATNGAVTLLAVKLTPRYWSTLALYDQLSWHGGSTVTGHQAFEADGLLSLRASITTTFSLPARPSSFSIRATLTSSSAV